MSKYHAVLILFFLGVLAVWTTVSDKTLLAIAWTGLLIGFIFLLAMGSTFPQWRFYLPVLNRMDTKDKVVCLTFDDGPDPQVTPKLLAMLKTEKVEAVFFYIGKACEANPDLVAQTAADGHLLGNHSFGHLTYWALMPVPSIRREIEQANQVLFRITGKLSKYYRPPFGVTRPGLGWVLKQLGMTCVGWQVRALEGFKPDSEKIIRRIVNRVRPGSIIMLHEGYYGKTAFDADAVVARTRTIIQTLRAKGYGFVRLDRIAETRKGI